METNWKRYERGLLERLRYDFPGPNIKVCGTIAGPHIAFSGASAEFGGNSTPLSIALASAHPSLLPMPSSTPIPST